MNNEKLSKQIAKKYYYTYDDSGLLNSYDECNISAMKMAAIKDGEFKNQEQSLLWTLYSILDGLAVEGEARENAIKEFKEHLKYYKEE